MSGRVFLDTNVLIYLYAENDSKKRGAASDIIDKYECYTSIQALNEACNVWFKKSGLAGDQIKMYLDNIALICDRIVPIKLATIESALSLKDNYGYSYYDCIMLASAIEYDCASIFTEDMNNGQMICNQLKISNPFVAL